jgi:hypothetical protein
MNEEFKVPNYVYNMCVELLEFIEGSTISDIISLDKYNMGSVDYSSKMSLHLVELKKKLYIALSLERRDKINSIV